MKTKQPHTIEITKLSHDGRGIGAINGKTTFVRGALPGETVEARLVRKHRRYNNGVATDVILPSAERVDAKCPHYMTCGGCSLQHMAPDAQRRLKEQTLLEQLQHIGNTAPEKLLPPLTGPEWGYRRKARLGVKYVTKKEKLLVGFREIDGRYIADIQSCDVLHPRVGTLITALSVLIRSLSCYQHIPQIEVAIGDEDVALVFRHLEPLTDDDHAALQQFGEQHALRILLQPKKLDSIWQLYPKGESELLTYTLPEQQLTFEFHPSDFTQVNLEINRQMVNRAIELLNPQANETLLDLFCGIGNFTLPLSKHCKHIVGVEGSDIAVERANHNANLNAISNTEYHTADLFEPPEHAEWMKQHYDSIILDPPRTGAAEMVATIEQFQAKKILYVSCNPATLARDTATLIEKGYRLTHAGIMDMFPHTAHVESIALFEKDAIIKP